MKPSRVLQLLPSLGMGGAERLAVHLARALDPGEFEVRVVSLYGPTSSDLERLLMDASLPVHYLGKRPGFDAATVGALRRIFREFRPAVVHSHMRALQYALPGYLTTRVAGKVHTVHSLAAREATRAGRSVQRLAFRTGVVPVAISREVARTVREVYAVTPPVIPNGIPLADYVSDPASRTAMRASLGLNGSDIVFICVANLSPAKNHARLLAAFAEAHRSSANRVVLLLVGDGPLRGPLEAAAAELGDGVVFLGSRTDVPALLAAADAFVLASDYEGNPLSVMEAMTAGLPVVATAVGGVPELVSPGRDGLLVPAGDPSPLAAAMLAVADDERTRRRLGRAAAATARERFGVCTMAASYGELYREVGRRREGQR